jgi:hypothetical protein
MKLLTTLEFVERAKAVHGDAYTYEHAVYINSRNLVEITCPVHGNFSQEACSHLMGKGCSHCGIIKNRKSAKTFITDAKAKHGDKYDYCQVEYVSNIHKVIIECPSHGKFTQLPLNHLAGNGCPQCGGKHKRPSVKLTTDQFIAKAKKMHGDKYDYHFVVYENYHIHVDIICRRHGVFSQKPRIHLGGQGCPHCGHYISKPETDWLDSLNIPVRQHSIKLPHRRVKVDGYDPNTNTIYQFHGSYYHGNPTIYSPETYNTRTKCSMGDLYRRTTDIENAIREAGYNLVVMWESEWKSLRKFNSSDRSYLSSSLELAND